MRKVEVAPHDKNWRNAFEIESKLVAEALGDNVVKTHHIGSTAIPGIFAKPVIDILIEVKNIAEVDKYNSAMESLGYEAMGEFGIPGRRYFRKDNNEGQRTHNIHSFLAGSEEIKRHLAFRDYMIAHSEDAQKYSELKRKLAKEFPTDINKYMDGKDSFIKEIDQKAAKWLNQR
ncbi:MAG: GrpB family protein [Candidatus Riflebacteria bacterium]|nr:GrpB family protein [Candidatus Riflebacteria bacterium]